MVGKQDGEYGYHIWNGKDLLTGIKATDNDFFGYGYNRRIEFRDYALTGSRDKTLFIKDSKPISEQKAYRLLRRMSKEDIKSYKSAIKELKIKYNQVAKEERKRIEEKMYNEFLQERKLKKLVKTMKKSK